MIHPSAQVDTDRIGPNTRVWQFAIILHGAQIGDYCNINCHTFIENDVVLGDQVTVKSGVFLWNGLRIGNRVFIGPNATFVNDRFPRSQQYPEHHDLTILADDCSIGAGAVILNGIHIGHHALVAAGSVVTRNVPAHSLVRGNPARQVGWVDPSGYPLRYEDGQWRSHDGQLYNQFPPPENQFA